ncbi:ORF6N domain-containing protein [Butyrivibrio fibrisolvens]|uniref:ORF6N domain-containing protein n=3 Tax=Butyrivibrio fibrisolvens TaxID=831 RepID=UPI0003F58D9C|nr:ORF6N domain-containing protein [Butyrivibrio fibrisolvens]
MDDKKKEVVGNTEIVPVEITEEFLKEKLYEVRGVKVMLDSDLAEIYGYETKNFNRQVKNNAKKFEGEEFMFRLTKTEFDEILRCKNFTSSWGGSRYTPYAFTEQGVYMVMTVLRGGTEIKIFSDNIGSGKLHNVEYTDFCKEYPNINLTMQHTGGIYHDRFIVLDYGTKDERVFLCGASSKDAGGRITSIVEDFGIDKYKPMIKQLLQNSALQLT